MVYDYTDYEIKHIGVITIKISVILYGETLAATTGTGCIRVVEVKAFAVQAV